MRLIFWAVVCIVGLVAGAWCIFAAVMTAALAAGPVTPQQLAGLRTSSNRLLLSSAAFACSSVFSLARLVLLMHRKKPSDPITDAASP